jgi:atypical dual specificity phosphatase
MASRPELLWWLIPGVLAGMRIPYLDPRRFERHSPVLNSCDDDLPMLYAAGVRAVVSLLDTPGDVHVYARTGFTFRCIPIHTGEAPSRAQAMHFVHFVNEQRAQGKPVAVHCQGGLGRTGTMMAVYLISEGDDTQTAIQRVRAAEPEAVETGRQVEFLDEFAQFCRRWM